MSEEENQVILIDYDRWPKMTRLKPYGKIKTCYYVNPENHFEVLPDPEKVLLAEEAFNYLDKGNSLREVCEWFNEKACLSVTHVTMTTMYQRHRKPFLRVKTQKKKKIGKLTPEGKKAISLKSKAYQAQKAVLKHEEEKIKERQKVLAARQEPTKYQFENIPQNVQIVFQPNEGPQTDFLAAWEQEVLYGGSAGGGKSYAMLADPMRYFSNPNFVGLLLRRTNDELRELIGESQKLYPKAYPGARWKEKDKEWVFPSGARFWMTYLERDDDVLRYQGQSFCWIGVDELTQYATPYAWTYLRSRLRTTDPDLPLCMRATTNPGGPGHQWVKKLFIDPAPENTTFPATDDNGVVMLWPDDEETPPELVGKPLFQRKFIPAKLRDNPYLMKDSNYRASLLSLPEEQRRKLLDGDWSVMEGAMFSEFRSDIHVCKPFNIPHNWRRFRSCDYGYSSYSAVHWFAIDPAYNTLYVYRELYVSKKTGKDLAYLVMNAEKNESVSYGMLDSSCWHVRGHTGPTIAEEMIVLGCKWRPSDRGHGSREAGANRMHELLKVNPDTNLPGIIFFEDCRQIISDLPMIPMDPNGTDDIDKKFVSDHAYDSVRYGIMSRPRSPDLTWGTYEVGFTPQDARFGY